MDDQPQSSTEHPYIPPSDGRCPIDQLPIELLSFVFKIGTEESYEDGEDDSDDEESTDSDDFGRPKFQLLVSHVCRRWRAVALRTPALWTKIVFGCEGDRDNYAMAREYLERSKTAPITVILDLDLTIPEEETEDDGPAFYEFDRTKRILECVIPHVSHWRIFQVIISEYALMNAILVKLGDCAGAPLLEVLWLSHCHAGHHADFQPEHLKEQTFILFGGNAPLLTDVRLQGVHLDWRRSQFLSGLTDLGLVHHAGDVRPSYADFARILRDSPGLTTLSLHLSGPAGGPVDWFESLQWRDDHNDAAASGAATVTTTLALNSLEQLVLAHLEPEYITPLLDRLALPKLRHLVLDVVGSDCTELLRALVRPSHTTGNPLVGGLRALTVSGMVCRELTAIADVYAAAPNLKFLNLDFRFLDYQWYKLLLNHIFLPRLEMLITSGLNGALLCKLVEVRRKQGIPLKYMSIGNGNGMTEYKDWLRDNVEELTLREDLDTESDIEEEDSAESDEFDEDTEEDPNDYWEYINMVPEGEDNSEDDDADPDWCEY
ncbi:hypothetical protein B0H21DRAFT_695813 [Amylocystis lapponica]|nr:hypothetical protein B0H21DRAFT_695813 [Amylocystis lapponica]